MYISKEKPNGFSLLLFYTWFPRIPVGGGSETRKGVIGSHSCSDNRGGV